MDSKKNLREFVEYAGTALTILVLAVAFVACTNVHEGDRVVGPDGDGDVDGDVDGDADGDVDGDGDGDPGIAYEAARPNLMLLVDRSGSMSEASDCGEARCPSKWDELVGLGTYLSEVARGATLGLALFPSPEAQGCSVQPSLMVPLTDDPDADQQVLDVLLSTEPGGRTPLAAALDVMERDGGLDDPEKENVLVILTDGQPNCFCETEDGDECERAAAVAAVERLVHRDPTVKVYILGFGSSAREAHETLSAMAEATGRDDYYQADTIEALVGHLYNVAVENVPCTYYLDAWPEPADLAVWMDDEEVSVCDGVPCGVGYTYEFESGAVEFHGASCDRLRDGERHELRFEDRSEG